MTFPDTPDPNVRVKGKIAIGKMAVLSVVVIAALGAFLFLWQHYQELAAKKKSLLAVTTQKAFPGPQAPGAPLAPGVLAQVGDWTLTAEDFKQRLNNVKAAVPDFDTQNPESKRLVLDEIVRQELLAIDAKERGLANKKEIEDAVEEFRSALLVREVASKLIENISATEKEAEDYYNQNKEVFVEAAQWRIREIVVPAQQEAKDILIELLKGADFGETAKARSKAKSAPQGGDLGPLKELPPALAKAVATLDVGDLSSVFKSPEGYSIVKLEEKRGGKPLSFSEVKADIISGLTQLKQQQAILAHIDQLRQKTPVKVNENLLNF